jgi:hypothetical protein
MTDSPKPALSDQDRYKLFRKNNGRCHNCGVRLTWEAHEVRGLSGGWKVVGALAQQAEASAEADDVLRLYQALCFKCAEFEGRGKTGRLFIQEE